MKYPQICPMYGWTCLSKLLRWVFEELVNITSHGSHKKKSFIDYVAFVDCKRQMAICTGWSRVYVPVRPPCFSWNYKVNSILCFYTNLILSPSHITCHQAWYRKIWSCIWNSGFLAQEIISIIIFIYYKRFVLFEYACCYRGQEKCY